MNGFDAPPGGNPGQLKHYGVSVLACLAIAVTLTGAYLVLIPLLTFAFVVSVNTMAAQFSRISRVPPLSR